jgi:O-antigen/teichoic acid export membrane protein
MFAIRFHAASRATAIFLLVSALQFLSSWLLLPFYLSRFSLEEFGVNELMNRVSIIAGFLISLRISGAMANQYFQIEGSAGRKRFVSSLFLFTLLSSAAGALLFLFFGPHLFDLFFADTGFAFWPYGCTALLTGILGNVMAPGLFFLRNEQRLRPFFLISAGFIAFNFFGQLAAIYLLRLDFRGVAIARSMLALVQILLMAIWCLRVFGFHPDWSPVRRALRYTLPLIPFLLLNWLQLYYDRFFVGREYGATMLGVFSVLVIAGSIHTACVDVFENVYRPVWMKGFMDPGASSHIKNSQQHYLAGIIFTAAAILFACILLPFFTSRPVYTLYAPLFIPVVAASVCKGISLLFIQQLVYRERSGLLLAIAALQFLLTWLCYRFLARGHDVGWVMQINVLLQLLFTAFFYAAAQRVFPIAFNCFWLFAAYGYVLLLLVLGYWAAHTSVSLPLVLGLQCLAVVVLFFFSASFRDLSSKK